MTPTEFVIVVLWLFAPAFLLGSVALWLWARRTAVSSRRALMAGIVAAPLAIALTVALLAVGSTWLPRWIGVHDTTIFGWYTMWSPAPFVSVTLVLPVMFLLVTRGRGRR